MRRVYRSLLLVGRRDLGVGIRGIVDMNLGSLIRMICRVVLVGVGVGVGVVVEEGEEGELEGEILNKLSYEETAKGIGTRKGFEIPLQTRV